MKALLAAALCLVSVATGAEPADERARLAAERQAVAQRFDLEEQACTRKFASTGCLADARARRRDALAPLRERELVLADQERSDKALERRRAVAAKQQAAADRPAALPAPAPVLRLRSPPPPAAPASSTGSPRLADAAAREADAAQRAQAQARRQAQIDASKKRVAERVAARASEGKPVRPLPPLPAPPGTPAR